MPKKVILFGAAFALCTACAETQEAVDLVARDAAKSAVNEALVTRFPWVPKQAVTPFTDCIIDNASAREIGQFAKDAVIGVTENTVTVIQNVLGRPDTQSCVTRAGLQVLAG